MTLNKKQKEAVDTIIGPILIIAGAGTGKTYTLTRRTMNIIEQGYDPSRILLMTFTNAAAQEMKGRIIQSVGEPGEQVEATTYHSFCAKQLRNSIYKIGYKPNFNIMDATSSEDSIKLMIARLDVVLNKERGTMRPANISTMFSYIYNLSIYEDDSEIYKNKVNNEIANYVRKNYPKNILDISKLCSVFHAYEEYKMETNNIDYDDIIYLMNKVFYVDEDYRNAISEFYQFKMVDEFQDSNGSQLLLLKNLSSNGNNNVAVVGDDQQSIYAFRGANFKNIIDFPDLFDDTKIIILNENYRSNQEILNLANNVIENAPEKFEKDLLAVRESGEMPIHKKVSNDFDQRDFVLDKILEKINEGVPLSEIAIIQRSSMSGSLLEVALETNKLDFQVLGGKKFLESEAVKDILAYLKVIVNPLDQISWYRLLKLYPGIGNHYASKIAKNISEKGPEVLLTYGKAKYAQRLPELYYIVSMLNKMTFSQMILFLTHSYTDNYLIGLKRDNHISYEFIAQSMYDSNNGQLYITSNTDDYTELVERDKAGLYKGLLLLPGEYTLSVPSSSEGTVSHGILKTKLVVGMDGEVNLHDGYYLALKLRSLQISTTSPSGRRELYERFIDQSFRIEILQQLTSEYATPSSFLTAITIDSTSLSKVSDDEKITITTIHSAKGLEFSVVFIISAVDGTFPRSPEGEELDEERRCFYVAVTRAKNDLYIVSPELVGFGKNKTYAQPSVFLRESTKVSDSVMSDSRGSGNNYRGPKPSFNNDGYFADNDPWDW